MCPLSNNDYNDFLFTIHEVQTGGSNFPWSFGEKNVKCELGVSEIMLGVYNIREFAVNLSYKSNKTSVKFKVSGVIFL